MFLYFWSQLLGWCCFWYLSLIEILIASFCLRWLHDYKWFLSAIKFLLQKLFVRHTVSLYDILLRRYHRWHFKFLKWLRLIPIFWVMIVIYHYLRVLRWFAMRLKHIYVTAFNFIPICYIAFDFYLICFLKAQVKLIVVYSWKIGLYLWHRSYIFISVHLSSFFGAGRLLLTMDFKWWGLFAASRSYRLPCFRLRRYILYIWQVFRRFLIISYLILMLGFLGQNDRIRRFHNQWLSYDLLYFVFDIFFVFILIFW